MSEPVRIYVEDDEPIRLPPLQLRDGDFAIALNGGRDLPIIRTTMNGMDWIAVPVRGYEDGLVALAPLPDVKNIEIEFELFWPDGAIQAIPNDGPMEFEIDRRTAPG